MPYTRYAVYFAPQAGSDLARFGASWLGWDNVAGAETAHPDVPVAVADITATPRKYGFHGTMKPPFRLAEGQTQDMLAAETAALAARMPAFDAPPLKLKTIGAFLALVPSAACQPLVDLASACVQGLDVFRATPSQAELAKRRKAGLTAQQDALLVRWGYPYVFDQFRFHLTLTGALDPDLRVRTHAVLDPMTQPLCLHPLPVRDIVLFGELDGGRFHQIARYALTG